MEIVNTIFGTGKDLNALQMSSRGIAMFIVALVLIRISGRRSFGMRTPMDNIVVVLLGAVLSRAITGASAVVPTICAAFVIVTVHRAFSVLTIKNRWLARFAEGEKIILYKEGQFIQRNLTRALVSQEDVMQGIRETALTDDLSKIDIVYMEKNGQISLIKKAP